MEMEFAKAGAQDTDEIGLLYDELCDYLSMNVNYPGWMKGIYPARETAAAALETDTLFAVRTGEKIIGTVILNRMPETGYENANWKFQSDYSDVLVIHTLAVHPAYLKSGAGKFTLRSCIDYAKANGIKALRLDVNEGNEPAIRLYETHGFTYIETVDLGLGKYGLDWFRLYELVL